MQTRRAGRAPCQRFTRHEYTSIILSSLRPPPERSKTTDDQGQTGGQCCKLNWMQTPRPFTGLLYSGGKLMRAGQRSSNQMRRIEIIPQFISSAEGSAMIRLGETQVICT